MAGHMDAVAKAVATQLANIEKRTGKSIAELSAAVRASGSIATTSPPEATTVEVEAIPTTVTWDPGDGTGAVRVAFAPTTRGLLAHRYERRSPGYAVTATLDLAVRWRTAGGRWQTLTPITRRAAISYPVIAARSVLVRIRSAVAERRPARAGQTARTSQPGDRGTTCAGSSPQPSSRAASCSPGPRSPRARSPNRRRSRSPSPSGSSSRPRSRSHRAR